MRVLLIPHGEEPYCSVIKTEHSSKLNWADLKIIRHIFSYHIGPLQTLPPGYFVCIYCENLTKIIRGNLWMDLFENKLDLLSVHCLNAHISL